MLPAAFALMLACHAAYAPLAELDAACQRFPDAWTAYYGWKESFGYYAWRRELPSPWDDGFWSQCRWSLLYEDARWRYRLWDEADYAFRTSDLPHGPFCLWRRLQALETLRELLTPEDFAGGVLPDPLPPP